MPELDPRRRSDAEPEGDEGRQGGVTPSFDPHPVHDRFLVAAHASGDLVGGERDRADALLAGCPECAQLAADLRSIAAATAWLPVPPRSRDFRLSAERAARLRPAGPRRLLAAFAGPRLAFTRPLATGLTTLGLAGLLLAALPGFAGGPAGGARLAELPAATSVATMGPQARAVPAPSPEGSSDGAAEFRSDGGGAVPVAPAESAPVAPAESAPAATEIPKSAAGDTPTTDAGAGPGTTAAPTAERLTEAAPSAGTSPALVLAAAFLLAGLGIFVLRFAGRRAIG